MTLAERAMVNQVQVLLCVLLVALIAIGVHAGMPDSCPKLPALADKQNSPPSARTALAVLELPRVEVLAHRRVAHAHQR